MLTERRDFSCHLPSFPPKTCATWLNEPPCETSDSCFGTSGVRCAFLLLYNASEDAAPCRLPLHAPVGAWSLAGLAALKSWIRRGLACIRRTVGSPRFALGQHNTRAETQTITRITVLTKTSCKLEYEKQNPTFGTLPIPWSYWYDIRSQTSPVLASSSSC